MANADDSYQDRKQDLKKSRADSLPIHFEMTMVGSCLCPCYWALMQYHFIRPLSAFPILFHTLLCYVDNNISCPMLK